MVPYQSAVGLTALLSLLLLNLVLAGRRSGAVPHQECESIKSAYTASMPKVEKTILATPTHDPTLELCRFTNHTESRRPSCCTRETELELLYQAPAEYKRLLQEQTKLGLDKIHQSNMTKIVEEFRSMSHIARKMTEYELGRMFQLSHTGSHTLVDEFFSTVDAFFIYDRSTNVFTAMDSMLDELFVLVVQKATSSTQELDPEYASCVARTRRLLSPSVFSQNADQFVTSLHYYLLAASYLSESIHIAENIFEVVPDTDIIDECFRDYVKLEHCQRCYGYYPMQPCREFCEDVFLVCMHQIVKLNADWDYHLRVINILAEYLLGRADVQLAMNGFSAEISSYADFAVTYYPNYKDKLAEPCGPTKHKLSSTLPTGKDNWHLPEITKHTTDMVFMFQTVVMTTEAELTGFFSSIPVRICSNSPKGGASCWDGLNERVNKKKRPLDFLDVFAPYPIARPENIKEIKTQIRRMRDGLIEIFTPNEEKQDNDVGSGSGDGEDTTFVDDSEKGDTEEHVTIQVAGKSETNINTDGGQTDPSSAADIKPIEVEEEIEYYNHDIIEVVTRGRTTPKQVVIAAVDNQTPEPTVSNKQPPKSNGGSAKADESSSAGGGSSTKDLSTTILAMTILYQILSLFSS